LQALILVCGRYEGIDERICQNHVDLELSIGDYVLTGGETAAMIVVDAVSRLIPGVLGGEGSAENDSFGNGLLEHAHYTRPPRFEAEEPPAVLLSGDHQAIEKWRLESALIRTFLKRKDLLENRSLSRAEVDILKRWCTDIEKLIRAQSPPDPGTLPGGQ
jgi:tRNA (guanine37-N1)-methyltransferase